MTLLALVRHELLGMIPLGDKSMFRHAGVKGRHPFEGRKAGGSGQGS